jgi:hypothetical protein
MAAVLLLVATSTSFVSTAFEAAAVVVIVYGLSVWSLQPGLNPEEFLTLLALPTLLTVGAVLLSEQLNVVPWRYFLPVAFGVGLYLTLLVENIFHVAASQVIPLLRAARTVGYLLTLGTMFILATLVFNLRMISYVNALVMFLVGGVVVSQALWSVRSLGMQKRGWLLSASLVSALVMGELALLLGFWPVRPLMAGLVMATMTYFLIGVVEHDWQNNLDRRTVIEYTVVGSLVLLLLIFTTSWTGY